MEVETADQTILFAGELDDPWVGLIVASISHVAGVRTVDVKGPIPALGSLATMSASDLDHPPLPALADRYLPHRGISPGESVQVPSGNHLVL